MRAENWRELVVAEALSWRGTKYHHRASVKGEGVDCAQFLVRVYGDLQLIPAITIGEYSPQWFLHQGEEKYLEWVERYCHQVEEALPGDIALYRMGRCLAHGAIILDAQRKIHAYAVAGCVSVDELRSPPDRAQFDSFWSLD
jgi:cell wall-associated NlpC family hydrolase